MNTYNLTRRNFVKTAALGSAAVASFNILGAQTNNGLNTSKLKVGVIGCGGRSGGDVWQVRKACEILGIEPEFVAIADPFADRVKAFAEKHQIDPAVGHVGFDAYHKVAESDAELVLMATPPNFRPLHMEACLNADKHLFVQKPVAVDPVGARKVMELGELADHKGLSIGVGTQRRSDKKYREQKAKIDQGAIGEIVGGSIYWNGQVPWISPRQPGQSDADYITRNWLNFVELSGDHIAEQHVHQFDIARWYLGRNPISFMGMGGRARRETGNQFDFFAVDCDYGDGIHVQSQCRQISGCYNRVGETFRGVDGYTNGMKVVGKEVSIDPIEQEFDDGNIQQQVELIRAIRTDKPINGAQEIAEASLAAIGGRMSAYTGKFIRWVDLTENKKSPFYSMEMSPRPIDFERGEVVLPEEVPAIQGEAKEIRIKT
ncbi:MAG: Gfo/Idh/MocA family oxidoreductase [Verrucomicrobiota bacterium]